MTVWRDGRHGVPVLHPFPSAPPNVQIPHTGLSYSLVSPIPNLSGRHQNVVRTNVGDDSDSFDARLATR